MDREYTIESILERNRMDIERAKKKNKIKKNIIYALIIIVAIVVFSFSIIFNEAVVYTVFSYVLGEHSNSFFYFLIEDMNLSEKNILVICSIIYYIFQVGIFSFFTFIAYRIRFSLPRDLSKDLSEYSEEDIIEYQKRLDKHNEEKAYIRLKNGIITLVEIIIFGVIIYYASKYFVVRLNDFFFSETIEANAGDVLAAVIFKLPLMLLISVIIFGVMLDIAVTIITITSSAMLVKIKNPPRLEKINENVEVIEDNVVTENVEEIEDDITPDEVEIPLINEQGEIVLGEVDDKDLKE